MINASKEFIEKLNSGGVAVNYADITLSNGAVLHLEPKDFMIGGCSIEDKTTDGKFGVGFVIGKTLSIRIANHDERFSVYDFYKSIINLYVAMVMDDGKIEKIRKGVYYTLVPETPGDTIEISAVDGMYKLDNDYSTSTTHYPATLQTIISDICLNCGISIGFRQFDNMSFVVQNRPENTTFRQVLSWAVQIAGYNARIDNDGYLQLIWYNARLLDEYNNYDGGNFSLYPHDTVIDGGDFTNYGVGERIDGGLFTDEIPEHIYLIKNLKVSTDDVLITGVRVIGEEDVSRLFGEEGYVIEVKDNHLVSGKESDIANYLGMRMVGMVFRPFSADILNNPLHEPFDIVRVSDRKGNVYVSLLNSVSYKMGADTQVACEAEDPVRNGSVYFSQAAAAVVEARKAQTQLTDYDMAVQYMNQIAINAMGFHTTYVGQPDGSRITYLHDKPKLEDSKIIYMQSIDGFFISQDGGKSYTAGFDSQGNVVINILYAIGIVADWIKSGRFEVRKGNQVTFLADADTGEVRIVADSFELTSGKTIDSIAEEKANAAATKELSDFVTKIYDPKISNLQGQIDGQIETWYYDYQPTLSNAPASSWKTEADRAKHEGDLFYWRSKGYSYRFFKDGNVWKWQIITDSDITKALSDAANAQSTANSKRRIFVSQPKPPYDKDDMWAQGKDGDIKICINPKTENQSFSESDWELACNYIDQTTAETVANSAADESWKNKTNVDVFNKLTKNGTVQGIQTDDDGNIYINASYINSGALSADYIRGGTLAVGGANNGNGIIQVNNSTGQQIGLIDRGGIKFGDNISIGYWLTSESPSYDYPIIRTTYGSISFSVLQGIISLYTGSHTTGPIMNYYAKIGVSNGAGYFQLGDGTATGLFFRVTSAGIYHKTSKSRIVTTKNYGDRLHYCYEMPSPMFGDIGEAITDGNGECYVYLDDVFYETVTTEVEYQVFLQKEGAGDIWVEEKTPIYFKVNGTENLKFAWEVKVKQKDYEFERLESFSGEPESEIDYGTEYDKEIDQLIGEREEFYHETA